EDERERSLRLLDRASPLTIDALPPGWRAPDILHLAPIADELPIDSAKNLQASRVVATPQGWMRSFSANGLVRPDPERVLSLPLERLASVVLSFDDLQRDAELVERLAARAHALVVTRGADGCSVYWSGRRTDLPALSNNPVDTVGAGDVFAAAFFIRLSETEDPVESGRFASAAAATFIEGRGVSHMPE